MATCGRDSCSWYQGFSVTQQGLAVLGPGEMRLGQDLAEHRVGRLRVGGGQAATTATGRSSPPSGIRVARPRVAPVLWSAAATHGIQNGLSRDISQQPRQMCASNAVRFVPRSG